MQTENLDTKFLYYFTTTECLATYLNVAKMNEEYYSAYLIPLCPKRPK